jgi:hypothetical protein
MMDEAVTVARGMGHVMDDSGFLSDAMIILAQAGRGEEAIAQFHANRERWPQDAWVHARDGVFERLPPLLDRLGRDEEADTLIAEDNARIIKQEQEQRQQAQFLNDLDRILPLEQSDHAMEEEELPIEPYVRPIPKIGRNDPCLCGSEKKYKKCCGGKL